MFRQRILMIKGNDRIYNLIQYQLILAGYDVYKVGDGDTAFRFLRKPPLPDLILSEYRLPDMKAEQFRKIQLQVEQLKYINTVFIYNERQSLERINLLDCISIPKYPADKLAQRIQLLLPR